MAREAFDLEAYVQRVRGGPCFICALLRDSAEDPNHIIYQDATGVVFLNRYPVLYGYTLVAPREHREQVTGDFTLETYLELQRLVYRAAEAVRQSVPTERMYILSLGSQQGNRHVHWHIAPLPPGVPYAEQQLEALGFVRGILKLEEGELRELAARIRARMEHALG